MVVVKWSILPSSIRLTIYHFEQSKHPNTIANFSPIGTVVLSAPGGNCYQIRDIKDYKECSRNLEVMVLADNSWHLGVWTDTHQLGS